ncbi:hypothetical protein GCM10020255_052900 [Rhodococcus baikonurensis]
MSESPRDSSAEPAVVDIVGVGFGPANLALAIAVEEHNANCAAVDRVNARFFEKQSQFAWHPGMLLDGATMQIAFPKDLVTFRNPQSGYSFFSYLFEQGRLVDFVNHQTFFPTRHEFNDYLCWAARRVDADVQFGTTVDGVEGIKNSDGVVDRFAVRTADGDTVIARNIVVGAGLKERIPEWATPSSRCFHNHQFLFHLEAMPEPVHNRFVVLGAARVPQRSSTTCTRTTRPPKFTVFSPATATARQTTARTRTASSIPKPSISCTAPTPRNDVDCSICTAVPITRSSTSN